MKILLVIDDSAIIRKIARRVAEGEGFHVLDAENCAEALAHCGRVMPDVILLDRGTEDMPAMDFVAQVRAGEEGDRPHIIICMMENEPLQMALALRHGLDDYIVKPFEVAEFRDKLDRAFAA